jgi:hypothetical protein
MNRGISIRAQAQRKINFDQVLTDRIRWAEVMPDWANFVRFDSEGICTVYEELEDVENDPDYADGDVKFFPEFNYAYFDRIFARSGINNQ